LYYSHRVKVLGRELQVRSTATADSVREVETFVNEKLKEVAASVNTSDTQIVAILALMNIAESYLALTKGHDDHLREGNERISRLLCEMQRNLE
jgi:cell division protein ZapA (FtsZ GTPase activity inhibitor)